MGSAGSDGPTVAFRIVIEHKPGEAPDVDAVLDALYGCGGAHYIEVHPAADPCAEVGHLQGETCLRCTFNNQAKKCDCCNGMVLRGAGGKPVPCPDCGSKLGIEGGAP